MQQQIKPFQEPPVRIPGMIMLGAAGRNAGKTEFACSLIKKLALSHQVMGIKVTTVHDRDAGCPRGENRCGACTSFAGSMCLSQEDGTSASKDTARMLSAGAGRVFWLRIHKESLAGSLSVLRRLTGAGGLVVCESNSLRLVVEPDLFIVIRDSRNEAIKPSCLEVIDLADAVVGSDGSSFTLPPEDLVVAGEHWTFKRDAAAVVLAGGASRRMGTDKAMLTINGRPMIQQIIDQIQPSFRKVYVSAGKKDLYGFTGCEVIQDATPGEGPLAALASVLERSEYDLNFMTPCDVPDTDQHLVAALMRGIGDADAAVPLSPDGRREPLFAVYRKSALPAIRAAIARGEKRIISFYDSVQVKDVFTDSTGWISNLNTSEDYRKYSGS